MTSIRNNPVWTPALIEQDKALKEKYGVNAHVIPATEADYRRKGLDVPKLKPLESDTVQFTTHIADNRIGGMTADGTFWDGVKLPYSTPSSATIAISDASEAKGLINQRYNDFREKYGENVPFNETFLVNTDTIKEQKSHIDEGKVGGMTADGILWDGVKFDKENKSNVSDNNKLQSRFTMTSPKWVKSLFKPDSIKACASDCDDYDYNCRKKAYEDLDNYAWQTQINNQINDQMNMQIQQNQIDFQNQINNQMFGF